MQRENGTDTSTFNADPDYMQRENKWQKVVIITDTPELIDSINNFYYDQSKHEQKKLLDGFAHPKDCEECLKELK